MTSVSGSKGIARGTCRILWLGIVTTVLVVSSVVTQAQSGNALTATVQTVFSGNENPATELTRFNGALYFVHEGSLWRVADGEANATPVGFSGFDARSLKVLDESLYFSAIPVESAGYPSIHRLDASGAITRLSGTDGIDEFVVYRDELYYLRLGIDEGLGCGHSRHPETYSVVKIDVDGSSAELLGVSQSLRVCLSVASSLQATSVGLGFSVVRSPDPRATHLLPETTLYLLREPTIQPDGASQNYFSQVVHYGQSESAGPFVDFIGFDEHLFFRGEHRHRDPGNGVGPYADPGRIPSSIYSNVVPLETELYRHDLIADGVYYDIHQAEELSSQALSELFTGGQFLTERGSSFPRNFVQTSSGLLFTASLAEGRTELFRVTAAAEVPEEISLNVNASSEARALGESGGRIWIVANTGSGADLHYLADVGAVPVFLDPSIAQSITDWGETDDGIAFAGSDETGRRNVYVYRSTEPVPEPTEEISHALSVDGGIYATRPGLEVEEKTGLEFVCELTNNTADSLTDVSMRLEWRRLADLPTQANGRRNVIKTCSATQLGVGETLTCRYLARPRLSTWRHTCVTKVVDADGKKLKLRDSAYVTRSR